MYMKINGIQSGISDFRLIMEKISDTTSWRIESWIDPNSRLYLELSDAWRNADTIVSVEVGNSIASWVGAAYVLMPSTDGEVHLIGDVQLRNKPVS